jgi:hypothetical protein
MVRLEDVYDAAAEQERLAAIVDPRYTRMLVAVHELVASAFPELQDYRLDDEAVRALLDEAAAHVVLIDDATRRAIAATLQEGQARGYSAFELAHGVPAREGQPAFGGIDGLFHVTWKGRSETVARNELAEAQHQSAVNRYAATGMVERVRLVENEDTDEPCAARNGQVVPLSPPPARLHVNCRLGLVPIVEPT